MSRNLLILALSLFVWGLGEGLFLIFQPLYLQEFGADAPTIGIMLGGVGLAMAAAQVPAGYLSDRIGARPLMWVAWTVGAIAAGLMALATSLWVFMAGMLLYSLTAFVSAPMNAYIANIRGKWNLARSATFTMAFYNLGAVAGPFIGGLIGDRLGLRQVYMIAFGVFIVSTLVVFLISKDPAREVTAAHELPHVHQNRRFLVLLPFILLTTLSSYLPQSLTANFLQNERGVAYSQIGILGSVGSFGVVLIALTLGHLKPLLGLLIGQAALALFSLCIWKGDGFGWYVLGYVFIGGFRYLRAMILASIRPVVAPSQVGSAFGVVELVNGLAVFFAANLAGWLYASDPTWIYLASLVLIGAAVALNLGWFQNLIQKAQKQSARSHLET